jgi:transcriptional regulator with GAF, ATPase, and Fis domain
VGSTKERPVLARFIAATNRDLHQMVTEGRFRSDLFYRLNVLTMTMPPLHERDDDVLLLTHHFAVQTERRYGLAKHTFARDAIDALKHYSWPGNVRELRHQISRAVLLSRGDQIFALELALPVQGTANDLEHVAPNVTLVTAEKMLIDNALRTSNHNVSKAARKLGITRMAMRYRMEKHGIKDLH